MLKQESTIHVNFRKLKIKVNFEGASILNILNKSCFLLTLIFKFSKQNIRISTKTFESTFDELQCLLYLEIERGKGGYGIYPASTYCLLTNEIARILLMRDNSFSLRSYLKRLTRILHCTKLTSAGLYRGIQI